ncbi:T9SS C-terminal target domain-containing protein [Paraflavitalea soli]|uniref:T9SS C-terminal target domain-containing protein n=1 Tax=Paraflavitalea soli TaxID=2315862 RepID=A0A3B7MPA5_9BACT|nr:T9SS type A sorting domain-containing protein [Paraflavitalea soli]AXY74806.1 T9SS C-terminal target domain-containing protein [Paraflavitalea soli]
MKGKWLLLVLALPLYASPQSTFLQLYTNPNDRESFKDMVQVSANEYAFITETFFYRVDGNGRVLFKKDMKEGQYTYLESIMVDNTGNFYIAAQVFTTVSTPEIVVYKMTSSGQLLLRKVLSMGSPFKISILPAPNDHFFVAYLMPGPSQHLTLHLLNNQGIDLWKKTLSRDITNQFAAHTAPNGEVELLFMTQGDNRTWITKADLAGNLTEKEILLQQPANLKLHSNDFCNTPDGGYAFSGQTVESSYMGDALLYKTDKDGHLQWKKEININRGDRNTAIAMTTDGFILLCNAGFTENWGSSIDGDLVLIKTDQQGNVQWKKAMGSAKADFATRLLIPDVNSILIGGQVSSPTEIAPLPMLCKTDNQGNLSVTLPFQPVQPATFKKIAVYNGSPVQKLVKLTLIADEAFIAGANLQNPNDDLIYPFILKADKTGQVVWNKQLTKASGLIIGITQTLDGHYMALVEQKGFFGKHYTLTKFNVNGDSLSTTYTGTTMLRDIIGVSDGGFLLTGMEDDGSLANPDLVLIKTDAAGKELWKREIGIAAQWELGRSIKETPDHDFVIAGSSQKAFGEASDAHVVKVNKDGHLLWARTIAMGAGISVLNDVALAAGGAYVMTGSSSPLLSDKKDVLVIMLDKQGVVLWEKTYDLHLRDAGLAVLYTAEDTILVAGSTGEPAAGRLEQYGFLMKLNKDGRKESVQYFGAAGVQTTVEKVLRAGDKIILAGNTQDEYGEGHMYYTTADAVAAAPPGEPVAGSLTLYPNPAYSKAFISMKNNYTGPVNIVLYNTTGQQVLVLQRTKTSFELKEEVPLSNLSSGMYYFFIQQGSDKSVKRLEIVNR